MYIKRTKICRLFALFLALALLFFPTALALSDGLPEELIPIGQTVGIDVQCDGAMLIATMPIDTPNGDVSPGMAAGLIPGDIIIGVGGRTIKSISEFQAYTAEYDSTPIPLWINRAGEHMERFISPVRNVDGELEMGLWLRDGMLGIGTVTFFDPASGIYGALGHSVSETETGVLMPIRDGRIMPASVKSVTPGQSGAPGELRGEFDFSSRLGDIRQNTNLGIFGVAGHNPYHDGQAIPVGRIGDVRTGAATILANVDGTHVREFAVEISRIFSGGEERNMLITVTDPDLLAITGGIVQGMSGSPIIQNGRLVGAVTHVLINNPQKGYAVFIEGMLESLDKKHRENLN